VNKLRRFIRSIIREEIGRNYHTIDNDPYSYEDYPDIDINIYSVPDPGGNKWFAQVTCDFDDKLSTPLRTFTSEEDAKNFTRQHAEQINRIRLANNINTGTPTISGVD